MPQHRVECDCGFSEQSVDTQTRQEARRVMHTHQQECDEYVTIWEAVHVSALLGDPEDGGGDA